MKIASGVVAGFFLLFAVVVHAAQTNNFGSGDRITSTWANYVGTFLGGIAENSGCINFGTTATTTVCGNNATSTLNKSLVARDNLAAINGLFVGGSGTTTIRGDSATSSFPWGVKLATSGGSLTVGTSSQNSNYTLNVGGNGYVSGYLEVGGNINIRGTCLNGCGISSLGGLTGTTQTFANDTNVTISSVGTTHTLGWSGTLAASRGGFGTDMSSASGVLSFNAGAVVVNNVLTANRVLYAAASNAVTSSANLIYEPTNGLFGIATATPGSNLSVHRSALIGGQLVASQIRATSTFEGAGLATCNSGQFLQWAAGVFGCNTPAGSGTINSGTTNRLSYYSGATTLDSANFLSVNTSSLFFGVGTTTPGSNLSLTGTMVQGGGAVELAGLLRVGIAVATSTLTIPFGTDPAVSASGQIAINTTTASSSERFYDGAAERVLNVTKDKLITVSSSTLRFLGAYGHAANGTTTIPIWNPFRPLTIIAIYCKTDAGSAAINLTDGTNATDTLTCNTSGTRDDGSIANSTFIMREAMSLAVGSSASNPNTVNITVTYREDAD